jgi:serine/threonine-protein kinase
VHRDVKPENIMLHGGHAMVADFGIALALSAAAGGRMTETGLSLGTPHYMSPEQATAAKEITARSDIYSLGSVLYEMLTGNPPHVGSSAQQIIVKIVTEEAPPVTQMRKSVPPNVTAAVARSLEKLPADRFVTAKEFSDALADPGYQSSKISTMTSARVPGGQWNGVALAGWLLWGLTVLAGTWLWSRPRTGPQAPVRRYALEMTGAEAVANTELQILALSPDGSRLAYVGGGTAGSSQLWIRDWDQLHGRPLPGTDGAGSLSWSVDGRHVAFMVPSGSAQGGPGGWRPADRGGRFTRC